MKNKWLFPQLSCTFTAYDAGKVFLGFLPGDFFVDRRFDGYLCHHLQDIWTGNLHHAQKMMEEAALETSAYNELTGWKNREDLNKVIATL